MVRPNFGCACQHALIRHVRVWPRFDIALAQMRATKDGDVRLMWSRILVRCSRVCCCSAPRTSLTHCHDGSVPTTQGACATATKETAAAYLKLIDEGTGMCDIRGRAVRV